MNTASGCSPSLPQYPELPSNQYDKAGPSDLGTNVDVPAIFLSHSGRQKPFVEHLYDALLSANYTPFFDRYSLPKGSPFPGHIERAARGCKLGIVVLSNDFLISKWPMMELQLLVLERGSDAKVLPLFYELQPKDLKSPTNLSKWRSVWKKTGNKHASQWEKAVELLDKFNGEIFVQGTSETAYIKKVVQHISTIVACPVPYDLSSIQGQQRLTEEIAKMFEHVKATRCCEELACMVGLHGVGGLGKITLCKSMVNFYSSQYLGRSCLIEFPYDGDKMKIAQESKRALKMLTSLSNDFLSNVVDSFDQVIELMKNHVKRHDVFLAIDNVWESSREEAERLLGVGFNAASKVLLTSRSEQVLLGLLHKHGSTSHIGPLPTPEHEEAYQIFQRNFELGDLRSLVGSIQTDKVLGRCRFNDVYHSLALKALAQNVQRVCEFYGLENFDYYLPLILNEISKMDLETVEQVIRLNYDRLRQSKKDIFLDIVIFSFLEGIFRCTTGYHWSSDLFCKEFNMTRWLCVLYKEFPPLKIPELIYELALDGLIQLGSGKDGAANKGEIGVHDLFLDLARREAAKGSRFLIKESTKSMEEMEWERLRRVALSGDKASHFLERLRDRECRKLQVLVATNMGTRTPVHLDCMPSLCVLNLDWDVSWDADSSSSVRERMGFIETIKRWALIPASRVVKLKGLDQLQELQVSCSHLVQRIDGLQALRSLQRLVLFRLEGLKTLEGLSGLIQLEALHVEICQSLKKLPDLRGLPRLKELGISDNDALEEVEGLSSSLEEVILTGHALKRRLDMRGVTCLERLRMEEGACKEELRGEYLCSNLKHLSLLSHCRIPKQVTLGHLTLLQSLGIERCSSIEKLEVGCHRALKTLRVVRCRALKEIGDFSALNCLQELTIRWCPILTKLGGLADISTCLKLLDLSYCFSLDESTKRIGRCTKTDCPDGQEDTGGPPKRKVMDVFKSCRQY